MAGKTFKAKRNQKGADPDYLEEKNKGTPGGDGAGGTNQPQVSCNLHRNANEKWWSN